MLEKLRGRNLGALNSALTWDDEVLFDDGDRFFADLLNGIAAARQTIELETYIFASGALANRLRTALIAAVKRGVCVRMMVDGWGSPAFWSDYGQGLQAAGVEVNLYRSLPWQLTWMNKPWSQHIWEFFRRWGRLNRGNHRKFCMVDDEVAWVGSFNISDVHLAEVNGEKAWLDSGLRIRGSELRVLREAFNRTFSGEIFHLPMLRRSPLILLNSSFILRRSTRHEQVRRLKNAKRRIWIQTPYFVPIRPIYRALLNRARRGVDVRIIIPVNSDVPMIRRMSYAFFTTLLEAGVKIYEYGPRFAHQKILQVDDWASIGSSNMNHRSFLHDLELDIVVRDPRNLEFLREKFNAEQAHSSEVTRETLKKSSLWSRLLGQILLAVRYWS